MQRLSAHTTKSNDRPSLNEHLTPTHASLTQNHAPLTQSHAPLTQNHVLSTQSQALLTQNHAPMLQNHAHLTQNHSPLIQNQAPLLHNHAPFTPGHVSKQSGYRRTTNAATYNPLANHQQPPHAHQQPPHAQQQPLHAHQQPPHVLLSQRLSTDTVNDRQQVTDHNHNNVNGISRAFPSGTTRGNVERNVHDDAFQASDMYADDLVPRIEDNKSARKPVNSEDAMGVTRDSFNREEADRFFSAKDSDLAPLKLRNNRPATKDCTRTADCERNPEVGEGDHKGAGELARECSKIEGICCDRGERQADLDKSQEVGQTAVSRLESRCTGAEGSRVNRGMACMDCKSSHLTDHERTEPMTNSVSANTANCCTLPQLTQSQRPTADTPSVGGASRSLRTACVQRYLPRAAHPISQSPSTHAMRAQANSSSVSQGGVAKKSAHKKRRSHRRKCIFVSYAPDCSYAEKRLVADVVGQLKLNNLDGDIWFDVDEGLVGEPCWLAARLEVAERCQASLMFLSRAYFSSSTCVYEARTILARLNGQADNGYNDHCLEARDHVTTYCVLYDLNTGVPDVYARLARTLKVVDKTQVTSCAANPIPSTNRKDIDTETLQYEVIDFSSSEMRDRSHDELCNEVVASFSNSLERHAVVNTYPQPYSPPQFSNAFPGMPVRTWTTDDVQDWLTSLSIREFYKHSFDEAKVDGNLLISLTDDDLLCHLYVDSRATRKKIMRQVLSILEKELKSPGNWHLRARCVKPKPCTVYLIYDPSDVRTAQAFKADLAKRNINVLHHQKLGGSKEEFLQLNSALMTSASHVIVLLTPSSSESPFVFHELLYADWLNKKLTTAVFKNCWTHLRSSLKAVLGEADAVDFEKTKKEDSLEALESLIRPAKSFAGVVLEQSYLAQMSDNVKTLASFSIEDGPSEVAVLSGVSNCSVYISYHWDSQAKVHALKELLHNAAVTCWCNTTECPLATMNAPGQGSMSQNRESEHRHFKTAQLLLLALTPKHLQSDACYKDLLYAENTRKAVVVALVKCGTVWPPNSAPPHTRRLLASKRIAVVDMNTDKLFRQNKRLFVDKVKRMLAEK